jgi:hypothetical protein
MDGDPNARHTSQHTLEQQALFRNMMFGAAAAAAAASTFSPLPLPSSSPSNNDPSAAAAIAANPYLLSAPQVPISGLIHSPPREFVDDIVISREGTTKASRRSSTRAITPTPAVHNSNGRRLSPPPTTAGRKSRSPIPASKDSTATTRSATANGRKPTSTATANTSGTSNNNSKDMNTNDKPSTNVNVGGRAPVACSACHGHKVRCDGGRPCSRCSRLGRSHLCQGMHGCRAFVSFLLRLYVDHSDVS